MNTPTVGGLAILALAVVWIVSRAVFRWLDVRHHLRLWGPGGDSAAHDDEKPRASDDPPAA